MFKLFSEGNSTRVEIEVKLEFGEVEKSFGRVKKIWWKFSPENEKNIKIGKYWHGKNNQCNFAVPGLPILF